MSNNYNEEHKRNTDLNTDMGIPLIGVALVIYNKKCLESDSFRAIYSCEISALVLVDNSTDPEIQLYNRKECLRIGCDYCSMDGNRGLAKAYNAALMSIGGRIDFLLLLDDDTIIPENLISILRGAITQNFDADVFVPYVVDQTALLSPCRRVSCLFFRYKKRPDLFTNKMSAINSGLVIHLQKDSKKQPLFNEELFLDCIDHDYILRMIRQGSSFQIYPVEFRQRFFELSSRDEVSQKERTLARFALFSEDYRCFCKSCSLSKTVSETYLLFRALKLNLRYKTTRFFTSL